MSSAPTPPTPKPGATYKFVVRSAEEAVHTIRERLGEKARVLSVRQVPGQGLAGLFSKPKLEVVAQMPEADEPELAPNVGPRGAAEANASDAFVPGVAAMNASELYATRAERIAVDGPVRDVPTRLPELLRRTGFSESTLGRLQATPAFAGHENRPLHHALAEVGQQIRRQAATRRPVPLPARTAFIGTAGVGRTTALCKWLAREVFSRQRMGRVLKAEFDKPNPGEGLAVFCEALGLTLDYYATGESEKNAGAEPRTPEASDGQFLYADLPALSLRLPGENDAIARFLNREKFAGRVLVLNALYDLSMLRRAYGVGRDLGATHLVFTHLDELEHWGKLWDFVLEGDLTPLFFATGSSLSGDCEEDALSALLRKTLPGA